MNLSPRLLRAKDSQALTPGLLAPPAFDPLDPLDPLRRVAGTVPTRPPA